MTETEVGPVESKAQPEECSEHHDDQRQTFPEYVGPDARPKLVNQRPCFRNEIVCLSHRVSACLRIQFVCSI